jgi:hypothetical protein
MSEEIPIFKHLYTTTQRCEMLNLGTWDNATMTTDMLDGVPPPTLGTEYARGYDDGFRDGLVEGAAS